MKQYYKEYKFKNVQNSELCLIYLYGYFPEYYIGDYQNQEKFNLDPGYIKYWDGSFELKLKYRRKNEEI